MKLFAIFFVCLLANEIGVYSDRMCGPKLAEIMWAVCENGFNEMMGKRSGTLTSALPAINSDVQSTYSSSSLSNIFQVETGNLLTKTRRIRMLGIADECCKKSCTFNELAAYCN